MISLVAILLFSQLDHFGFDNISSPRVAGTPFPVAVHAYDAIGNPYPFDGYARIYTSWDIPINPQYCDTLVHFSNGDWTGDVTVSLAVDTLSLVCDVAANNTPCTALFVFRKNWQPNNSNRRRAIQHHCVCN